MVDKFCSRCGKRVRQEHKFCPECGKPLVSASAPPTPYDASWMQQGASSPKYRGNVPQQRSASTSPYAPSETEWRLRVGLYLGLIGGVFGILFGIIYLRLSFGWEEAARGVGAIVFAIIGIVGGSGILSAKKAIGGILMIIGGAGMILTILWFGAFSAILFFLGGFLILMRSSWAQGY